MTRKVGSMTVFAACVTLLILIGFPHAAPARNGCSNESLRGSFGISATGTVVSGPTTGPLAFVGVVTFDGRGQLTGELTQRLNTPTGPTTLTKVPYTGVYNVNPDCTVEDTWINVSNGSSSTHESVLADGGRLLMILNTTTGAPVVASAIGQKLSGRDRD